MSQPALNYHLISHSNEKKYVCEICAKSFKHHQGFSTHMRKHDGSLQKKFICGHCGKAFYNKYDMQLHIRTHTGVVSLEKLEYFFLLHLIFFII